MDNLARVKSTLLQSGLQKKDPALYQAINTMINLTNDNIAKLDLVTAESAATKQLLADVIRLNGLLTP